MANLSFVAGENDTLYCRDCNGRFADGASYHGQPAELNGPCPKCERLTKQLERL